jgi:hypothetical protein
MLQRKFSQVCMRGTLLLAVASLLSPVPRAAAQNEAASAPQPSDPCTPGVSSYVENTVISVTGLPYSAMLKVTFDQQMSDGSMVHGITRTLSARDSSGKTRMETSIGCWLDKDGQSRDRLNVRIADPLAGTFLEWSTGGPVLKVAHLISQPEAFLKLQALPVWRDSESEVQTPGQPTRIVRTELLGTTTIDGVEAQGLRTTTTIPRGAQGNKQPIVSIHEQWMSMDLGIVMQDLVDDPVRGRTEMELEDFTPKEPDRALFLPPAGYKIIKSPATPAPK